MKAIVGIVLCVAGGMLMMAGAIRTLGEPPPGRDQLFFAALVCVVGAFMLVAGCWVLTLIPEHPSESMGLDKDPRYESWMAAMDRKRERDREKPPAAEELSDGDDRGPMNGLSFKPNPSGDWSDIPGWPGPMM